MIQNRFAIMPVYQTSQTTINNGVDIKKLLDEADWKTILVPLTKNQLATVAVVSDGSGRRGSVNGYTITCAGGTYKVRYLRQVVSTLNGILAQIAPTKADAINGIRFNILTAMRANDWKPVKYPYKSGVTVTITKMDRVKNGKTMNGYELKTSKCLMYAATLQEAAEKIYGLTRTSVIRETCPF